MFFLSRSCLVSGTTSRRICPHPWNRTFTLDATHGQPHAYWAATQTPDGIVHLSDGRLHYAFNLAWLLGRP